MGSVQIKNKRSQSSFVYFDGKDDTYLSVHVQMTVSLFLLLLRLCAAVLFGWSQNWVCVRLGQELNDQGSPGCNVWTQTKQIIWIKITQTTYKFCSITLHAHFSFSSSFWPEIKVGFWSPISLWLCTVHKKNDHQIRKTWSKAWCFWTNIHCSSWSRVHSVETLWNCPKNTSHDVASAAQSHIFYASSSVTVDEL